MKVLDRYLIREILPPFLVALGLFTFLMAVKPMLDYAQDLLAKGAPLPTIGLLLLTLLPQALGVAIPMAFLTGVLMGLGRLSADREAVAALACGVSPLRLLRPVLILAILAGGANMYLLMKLVPDSNQRFREITYQLLLDQGFNDIRPQAFYEGFPNTMVRVREVLPGGNWSGVMLADTSQPGRPALTLASEGFFEPDEVRREVSIVLPGESLRYVPGAEPDVYDTALATDMRTTISADQMYGSGNVMPSRGTAEMTIAGLRREEALKVAAGLSPHREIIFRHQMVSFPLACVVFALIGVALGLHTRKAGALGGLSLGLGVIAIYYALMALFESLAQGQQFPAEWARWIPNIVVGAIAVAALRARMRNTGREWAITLPGWASRLWRSKERKTRSHQVPAAQRVVVVIRMPDIRLPSVRLLDRYVSRRYLNVAVLSFFGLLLLYYVGTFIDKSSRLFKGDTEFAILFEYFYQSTPQFIVHVAPMATLVAVLATIGGLMRTGELTVMRACGVSLYRVGAPLLLLALVWSGGLFVLDDRVLAHANRRADVLENQMRGIEPRPENMIASTHWTTDGESRVFYYTAFDIPNLTLYGLSVFELDETGTRLTDHTVASTAMYEDGRWNASNGWTQSFPEPTRAVRADFAQRTLELPAPDRFSGRNNQTADELTYGDLRQYVAELAAGGATVVDARVELAKRLAFPFATVVMTLLGIAFGVSTGKRGALYGVGLALLLGATYWLADTFFVAFGQAGLLPPWLSAWAANLLFLALALYAVLTVRT